jgi:predicted nucleic acid-binding protein
VIIVDTNIVSELLREDPDESVAKWVDSHPLLSTTAITVQESYYGLERMPESRRRSALFDQLDRVFEEVFGPRLLPYDAVAARCTAALVVVRERMGRPIGVADAQIAGIALAHGASLATRNTRDFAGLPLDVVDPWRR